MLIDCHCHLYPPEFPEAVIPELLTKGRAAGIAAIIVTPETLQQGELVLNLAEKYPLIHACLGLHPVQNDFGLRTVRLAEVAPVLELIRQAQDRIVAVGECGLDFSPHVLRNSEISVEDQKQVQRQVFLSQIRLANELNLPLNVHSRQAGHYVVDMLIENNANGLLHAFDGKVAGALKAVQNGNIVSIAPSIVRDHHLQKLAKALPLDRIVLETDAPALSPVAGELNVPANITLAVQALAEIKGVDTKMVADITTENSQRFFPKLGMNRSSEEGG